MDDSFVGAEARRSATQFFRYGLLGIATNAIGYSLFLLITYFGGEHKRTMTLLYALGAIIGFLGNRQWTFAHKGAALGSGTRYLIAHFLGYLINLLILLTLVDRLGYSHQWVQAAAIIVVAGFLFCAFKYFVFPTAESGRE